MADWSRKTSWRQGHVLTNKSSIDLGLVSPENVGSNLTVVISHDCDLAQLPESEPLVEVIVSQRIEKPDGNCTHAKNARRLRLPYTDAGVPAYLDLRAQAKATVQKGDLANHAPNTGVVIDSKSKGVLQRWLAVRYRRAAFPDEFVTRLRNTKVAERIVKILEPLEKYLAAVFFDVDEGEDHERHGPADVYALRIYLLYDTSEEPEIAHKAAEKAAKAITAEFNDRCLDAADGWQWIRFDGCVPIADEAMSIAQSMQLKQASLDYLSFRGGTPEKPILE